MVRWREADDAEAQADAGKYEKLVPSRAYLGRYLRAAGKPLVADSIARGLGLSDAEQLEGVERRLNAMVRDGELVRNRAGGYGLAEKMDLVRGTVEAHRDGYGFLRPDGGGQDLFLSPRTMRGLVHGDRVLARLSRSQEAGRREAKLVEVIERNTTQVIGRFFRERGIGFVYPERRVLHRDLLIPPGLEHDAREGQMVVATLVEQPSPRARPVGEVTEILGEHMAPGLEIDVAIRSHGIPDVWPTTVEAELEGRSPEVEEADKAGRKDLRDLPLVTIDGADAKDFDDAVFCRKTRAGWRLIVAIADVSSYVRPGSALDVQAQLRGNSTYFPGRVVPMLPELLSNGLCSLNPERDRLAMVCDMLVDGKGQVTRSGFYEGLIRSAARLTYDEVAQAVVEGDAPTRQRLEPLLPHLDELRRLYKVLAAARTARGCIEFESTETQIVFGPEQKIDRVVPVRRNDAHKMIEECMIAANVCAARFLARRRVPALYRVHPQPAVDKLTALREFLGPLSLRLGGGKEPRAQHFAALAQRASKRPDAALIHTVMLRSLPQARYAPACDGHFGLALAEYTHFTSPIRRYPDLIVHRAIKHALAKRSSAWPPAGMDMAEVGALCSATERRSDEASRDVVSWLKCEYMQDKVGEMYDGLVSGVAPFGAFVQLEGVFVEGLVHVSALGSDYFHFEAAAHSLTGERSGKRFTIGDRVRVRVVRVDLDERKIDFELAAPVDGGAGAAPARRRRSRRRRA